MRSQIPLKSRAANPPKQAGLTLVELVVTIVLMGILAGGTVAFVTSSTQSYVDTATRNQLSSIGRLTVSRFELAIKNAVPNSIRTTTDGDCVEYLPIVASTFFINAPIAGTSVASATTMNVVSVSGLDSASYVVLYPTNADDLYQTIIASPGSITSVSSVSGGEITFDASHTFSGRGPTNRVYFAGEPEAFCLVDADSRIYRYKSGTYAMQTTQPLPASLPSGPPSRAVVSSQIANGPLKAFEYEDISGLQNSGLLRLTLKFTDGDETMLVEHDILNANAP